MFNLIVTLVIGLIGGSIAVRLKVPAGAMIGSMLSVALFNIITGDAFFPQNIKIVTQIAAGAFIGAGIKHKDVRDLRLMVKPAVLMVSTMIILDLFLGYIMHRTTGIDLITALFASAPGGVVDMSLISADLGADSSKVAILQLVRLMSVMIVLPSIVKFVAARVNSVKNVEISSVDNMNTSTLEVSSTIDKLGKNEESSKENAINFALTMILAFAAGLIGYILKIPAGAMTFSMIAVGAFNVFSNRGHMPLNVRRLTQVCAGALIGERMTLGDILALRVVILPAFILLVGIIIVNLFIGFLISRVSKLETVTSLLASAPGGLSDMALIAKDLGGDAPKVAILQLARYTCVIGVFPIIIKFICS